MLTFDNEDREILNDRAAKFNAIEGMRVGDFIKFADGSYLRIAYIWGDEEDDTVQPSHSGSYYFNEDGYVDMSGSLHSGIPRSELRPTDEKRMGRVWFFHHGHREAHNAVDAEIEFRVYACDRNAP